MNPNASFRRILVVEDDPTIRSLLACLLGRTFAVETAPGGVPGLARCLAEPFDAVVSDIRMPDLDGVSMVLALRQAGLRLPVVFVTGTPGDLSALHWAALQPARLVAKPCGLHHLQAALGELGL